MSCSKNTRPEGGDVPLDQVCLADVRERQITGRVHDLDGAGFDPAVAAAGGGVGDRDVAPGQGVEGVEQAGLVVFGRQDEVRAAPVQVVRRGALAMQGIGRHDSPVQVHAVQQRDDHRNLIRLGAGPGLSGDDARPARAASRCTWLPSAFRAPRTVLPSTRTGISTASSVMPWPVLARFPAALARSISHEPVTASNAAVSAPVTTRQIVDFDGGPARGRPAGPPLPIFQNAGAEHTRPNRGSRGATGPSQPPPRPRPPPPTPR